MFTFTQKPIVSKVTTVGDITTSQSFQTDFGTIYTKLADGSFLKLGNPSKSSHNEVRVKPASYFNLSRQVTPVNVEISFATA